MPRASRLRLTAAGVACGIAAGGVALVAGRAPVAVAPPGGDSVRAGVLAAGNPEPPTDVLVRFERDAERDERAAARRAAGVDVERTLPVPRLQLVHPGEGVTVREAIAQLERSDAVTYAEPDVARRIAAVPDDGLFGQQWGLHNVGQTVGDRMGTVDADIDAPEAWDITTGAAGVTVAVVDTGLDAAHPDLAPNLWTNPGESGEVRRANGIDDDGNGYVDDLHGWDFVQRDAVPQDGNGHGTHVAGTVGARGNDGRGVSGVAWRVGLLPLRVLGDDGSGRVSDIVAAYALADRFDVRILNASLGGSEFSRSERDAIRAASSTLFVVAAGNDGADNDVTGSYPCGYDLPNIVCVAAVERDGSLTAFSNRGALTVDLAAPGAAIASTYPGGTFKLLSGTSMAAPHVAGAAALLWSLRPDATVAEVRDALLGATELHPSLVGSTVTGGTLNARRAVDAFALGAVEVEATPAPAAPAQPQPDPTPTAEPQPVAPSAGEAVAPAPITNGDQPAPAIAPGVADDTTPPRIRVSAARAVRTGTLLRRGLGVSVECSERCTIRARLTLPGGPVLGRARSGAEAGASRRVRVRVFRRFARRVRRSAGRRIVLVTTAADAAGNVATARRRLRVRG